MKIKIQKDLKVPASAAWHLMGDRFADVADWSETVVASSLEGPLAVGSVRSCELKGSGAVPTNVKERLTRFDPASLRLGYVVTEGMPGFMRHAENNWTIRPNGPSSCRVTSELRLDVAWYMAPMVPMMKMQFRKLISGVMDEMEANAPQMTKDAQPPAPELDPQLTPA